MGLLRGLYEFPDAAVTNYHKAVDLKPQQFLPDPWRLEV